MPRHVNNTCRRIPTISISLFLGLMFFFVACNDDEPERAYSSSGNANSNATQTASGNASYGRSITYGNILAVTEGNANICEVANRLEIPRLKGGPSNLFVVHTTEDYGVNYCIEWNCDLRAQYWSAYRWDRSNSVSNTRRTDLWAEDPLIPINCRSTLSDHQGNGYDRGHIVGSQDRVCSFEANAQTFYMSNMHPQLNSFNAQGIWYELENRLRNTYNQNTFRDTLYVVKGGTIGQGQYTMVRNLPVPKYFFMALLRKKNSDNTQGGYAAVGFWMEHKGNTDTNYKRYAVSIDKLEELTGIDFFCNLPDNIEEQVESNFVNAVWKLN